MKRNKEISFSIDKKLIFLVMVVSVVTITAVLILALTLLPKFYKKEWMIN